LRQPLGKAWTLHLTHCDHKAITPGQASKDAARAQPAAQMNILNKASNLSKRYQMDGSFFSSLNLNQKTALGGRSELSDRRGATRWR
jgi:hypothetical protein